MRTIYWRKYGVVVPVALVAGLVILTAVAFGVRYHLIKKSAHPAHQEHHNHVKDVGETDLETDDDFANLVRRPNLEDEEEEADDGMILDPEDDTGGLEADLSETAPAGKEKEEAWDGMKEKTYTTESPSDLQDDNGDKSESSTTTVMTTTLSNDGDEDEEGEEGVDGFALGDQATTQAPALEIPVQAHHGNMPAHPAAVVGVPDYEDLTYEAMPTMDFQDGPLSEDEEYSLHLDEDAAMHAREGLHGEIKESVEPDAAESPETDATAPEISETDAPPSQDDVPAPEISAWNAAFAVGTAAFTAGGDDYDVPADTTMEGGGDDDYEAADEEDQTMEEAPEWYTLPEKPHNVLFVVADDMRPQLGVYEGRDSGAPFDQHEMYTPHLDRLARRGLLLKRAYAQYSMCGPSRSSMMTSRRPDTTKVYQNYVYWRYWSVGNFTTIPQYFKEHNYTTLGAGKVFHVDMMPKDYDPVSWTLPYFRPRPSEFDKNTSINWAAVPDDHFEPLIDQNTVQYALNKLPELAHNYEQGNPFFFAVGFNQPHFRHVCPAKFFDLYPLEKKKCMFKEEWQTPPLLPKLNLAQLVEGKNNSDLTNIPSVPMREMRRAYFACISYIDHLMGQLMIGLQDNGLADNTIVVFVSDQGYHAGDNDQVGVYSNHEVALHVPLIIKIPGATNRGIESRALVELVDIFPTLVHATGLPPLPRCPERSSEIRVCTDGTSLLPLIRRPKKYVKDAAYSQLARGRSLTEYTVRTNQFRLVDLAMHRRQNIYTGVYQHALDFEIGMRGRIHTRRLYDLTKDPLETASVANVPEYQETVNWLRSKLRNKFTNIYDYSKYLYDSYPG